MPTDTNHYTRAYTEQENPEKSDIYDTGNGKAFWDGNKWSRVEYWYKPVEEVISMGVDNWIG